MSRRRTILISAVVILGVVAAACSNADHDDAEGTDTEERATCKPVGDVTTATAMVNIAVSEWLVKPEPASVPAGNVAFAVRNDGHEDHELVIVKGVAPNDLPRKKDGSVHEDKLPSDALVGEIEEFAAGTTCTGVFSLTAGDYTLLCNVVEEEENGRHESHLKQGMVTRLAVT